MDRFDVYNKFYRVFVNCYGSVQLPIIRTALTPVINLSGLLTEIWPFVRLEGFQQPWPANTDHLAQNYGTYVLDNHVDYDWIIFTWRYCGICYGYGHQPEH